MILRKLRAENLLKYAKLELSALPAHGVIGISGRNESGKSAMVEAICLALFGRTYALPPEELAKAVRWGAASASVSLEFADSSGAVFTVTRYLDQNGNQRARLAKGSRKEALVQGTAEVNAAIVQMLGFDFPRYAETLYLAQKRGDQAGASSATIRVLAGVDALERIAATLREEMRASEEAIQRENARAHTYQARIAALGVRDETLGELESRLNASRQEILSAQKELELWALFGQELDQAAKRVEGLDWTPLREAGSLGRWQALLTRLHAHLSDLHRVCHDSHVEMEQDPTARLKKWATDLQERLEPAEEMGRQARDYIRAMQAWLGAGAPPADGGETLASERARLDKRFAGVRLRRRLTTPLLLLTGLATALGGGAWHLLTRMADSPQAATVTEHLTRLFPQWNPSQPEPLLVLTGIAGGLFLLTFVRYLAQGKALRGFAGEVAALAKRRDEYQSRIDLLTQAEEGSLAQWAETLERFQEAPWSRTLPSWREGEGSILLEPEALTAHLAGYRRKLEEMRHDVEQIREDVQGSMEETRDAIGGLQDEGMRLEAQIREEQTRRQQDRELRAQMAVFEEGIALERRRIQVRQAARHLLRVAGSELSMHFNQELHRFLTRVVPLFTENRYQELRIGADLAVEVFSRDKNDFVALEEISSGVQHQLLLAVRVALAQALVSRTGSAPQFMVLDEPFAFFDRVRQNQALASLGSLSDDLAQFWVITQEFDPEPALERSIVCALSESSLTFPS